MQKSERIVRYTASEIDEKVRNGEDRTDWERVRNLTLEEIEASIDFEDEGTFDFDLAFKLECRTRARRSPSASTPW